MKVIGLTGPSGAGKSCCGDFLETHGIPTINADEIYHRLIGGPSECVTALRQFFGDTIVTPHGSVDRKALAAIVFSGEDSEKLQELNRIAHSYVRKETMRLLEEFRSRSIRAVVVDAPLLFEASFDQFCDFTIAVLAPLDMRRERIMTRDHLTREAADARLNAQKKDEYYTSHARHIIVNDSTTDAMWAKLKEIFVREGICL